MKRALPIFLLFLGACGNAAGSGGEPETAQNTGGGTDAELTSDADAAAEVAA